LIPSTLWALDAWSSIHADFGKWNGAILLVFEVIKSTWFTTASNCSHNSLVSLLFEIKSISKSIRIFANHISDSALLFELLIPSLYTISGWFLLQSLEDSLIFNGNLYKLFSSLISIETSLGRHSWWNYIWIKIKNVNSKILTIIGISLLHDVGHLFKKNSVFSFYFGVAFYKNQRWLVYSIFTAKKLHGFNNSLNQNKESWPKQK